MWRFLWAPRWLQREATGGVEHRRIVPAAIKAPAKSYGQYHIAMTVERM